MGHRTTWLLSALLLVIQAGSFAITGPREKRGVVGNSLTVQCRYDPGWETHVKWWCRGAAWSSCKILVKTTGSEKEVKKDRVSIRDTWKNRSFTMTMKELSLSDADTYWCGIERVGTDLATQVKVTVDPAPTSELATIPTTTTVDPFTVPVNPSEAPVNPSAEPVNPSAEPVNPSSEPVNLEETSGCSDVTSPCSNSRSLLGSIPFLLLVFLEVPLLLGMLSAVLWVNRPLRSSGGEGP